MKKWLKLGAAALLFMCLTGCAGKTDSGEQLITNLEIQKDGKIVHTIYSDFKEAYYNLDDLSDMVQSSIKEFGLENPNAEIILKSCEVVGDSKDMVKGVMVYDDYQAYTVFNGKTLFVGTIQEAYEAGYDLNMELTSVSAKDTVDTVNRNDLLNMSTQHIVISEENLLIHAYAKIQYVSEHAALKDKDTVMMEQTQGNSAIVFK